MLEYTFLDCCLHLISSKQAKVNKKDQLAKDNKKDHLAKDNKKEELAKVICTLELLAANMAVALVYLHKYQSNSINQLDTEDCPTMPYYVIVASLVLANKFLNDQSYTLKTWHSILTKFSLLNAPLSLLNQLEINFLAGLNYALTTKHDSALWSTLTTVNTLELAHLRLAIDLSTVAVATVATTGTGSYGVCANACMDTGLVALPLQVRTAQLSPQKYMTHSSYNSTPVAAGPVTPVSQLFVGGLHTPLSQVPIETPQWMGKYQLTEPAIGWEQPLCKRRKVCAAAVVGWSTEISPAYLTN